MEVKYYVGIGGAVGTGYIFVPDNATDKEIKADIFDDLYDAYYEIIDKQKEINE